MSGSDSGRKDSDSFALETDDLRIELLRKLYELRPYTQSYLITSDEAIINNGSSSVVKLSLKREDDTKFSESVVKCVGIIDEKQCEQHRMSIAAVFREVNAYSCLSKAGYFSNKSSRDNIIPELYGISRHHKQLTSSVDLVMELASGVNLFEIINQGYPLTVEFIARIAKALLLALKDLHSLKLIHRDINPGNVIVDPETGRIRLIDLGACFCDDRHYVLNDYRSVIGTAEFGSPEMMNGQLYNASTDIFSLGLLLCGAATGEYPYPRGIIESTEKGEIIAVNAPSVKRSGFEHLPSQFFSFLKLCLEVDSANRKSAEALLEHAFVEEVDISEEFNQKFWFDVNKTRHLSRSISMSGSLSDEWKVTSPSSNSHSDDLRPQQPDLSLCNSMVGLRSAREALGKLQRKKSRSMFGKMGNLARFVRRVSSETASEVMMIIDK
eukprot:TRINITY_DN1994_c0_g1_i1.p1 TRINITY_DN1994_c0_g1~~TRINITY_DN1994_c0_g1_i1.p1  ORF type:complete len:439 (-),score=98.96 TRINITY_DN1994_c0_g1_i1:137-1453(-)